MPLASLLRPYTEPSASPPDGPMAGSPARPSRAEPDRPVRSVLGGVEYFVLGQGSPVTILGHGLAGSIAETRPLAAQLPGTRVFLHFRGHGGSVAIPQGWDYDSLAEDLITVADAEGATGAIGVSMGAGALMHLASERPDRFSKLAFVMPAALTEARTDGAIMKLHRVGEAIATGDQDQLAQLMLEEVPEQMRGERIAALLSQRRARDLIGTLPPYAKEGVAPLTDIAELAAITAPSLVIAQESDPLHPVPIARELAQALPNSELLILPVGGVFWTQPETARAALAAHLAPQDQSD